MSRTLEILLADDHQIVRQGLELLISEQHEDLNVSHASTLLEVQSLVKDTDYDLIVLDAQFSDGNSLSILREVSESQKDPRILMFTSFQEANYSIRFLKEGATGFLSKASEEPQIVEAIASMLETGTYLPPLTQQLLSLGRRGEEIINPLSKLSDREMEVAQLLAEGKGNLEISATLDLKQNTVSTFKRRIFEKLEIESMVDLLEIMRLHRL